MALSPQNNKLISYDDTQNITETNPIRYRGYYYDTEMRLYYVNSRYYDPAVKRFLNSDDDLLSATSPETLTDKNYFAYCDNNPVSRTDGEGTIWHIVAGAVIGGVLNSITDIKGVVDAYKSDGNVKQAWLHLGISFTTGAVSGGLSMTGVGAVASAGINAALSGGGEFLNQVVDHNFDETKIDYTSIAYETAFGAVTSFEKGAGSKSATDLGKGTINKTFKRFDAVYKKKGLKAAVKSYKGKAAQQAGYYLRSTKKMTSGLKKNIKSNLKSKVLGGIIKSVFNKIKGWFN